MMADIQHNVLTDPYLHEPKGIAAASANQVYISDGAGSGGWTNVNRLPGTGWGKYTNTFYTGGTTLAVSTTPVLCPFTTDDNVSQIPVALDGTTTSLMNLTTDTLLFVSAGDLHSITLTFDIASTSGTPVTMDLRLLGSTDGVTYSTMLGETTVSLAKGAGQTITESSLFNVTSDMASHGAKIYLVTNTGIANIQNIGLISARVHKNR